MKMCSARRRLVGIGSSLLLAGGLVLGPAAMSSALAAAPSNDSFAAALAPSLPYGPVGLTTELATTQTDEPQPACGDGSSAIANTIWFRIDAPAGQPYEVSALGNFDPKVAVWQGTSLSDLELVACAHQSGVLQQVIDFPAGAGLTYWVQVGGDPTDPVHGSSGFVELRLRLQPPVAWMAAKPSTVTSTSVVLRWGATPGAAAIRSYDVRYAGVPWNGTWRSAVRWHGTSSTKGTFRGTPGATYCFAVMAQDWLGVASAWADIPCFAVPLDDRSLVRSAAWTRGTGSHHFQGTYVRASTNGATLTRTRITASHLDLVAMTCSTCGKVRAYWNGALVATIDLHSPTTVYRRVLPILDSPGLVTGTLTIRVFGSGRRVVIDGVGIRRL